MIEALLLLTGLVAARPWRCWSSAAGAPTRAPPTRRILFPYVGSQLSVRALDAALRIARFEDATLVAAYLVPVPMTLSLEAPIPRACGSAFELQEAIEQRAAAPPASPSTRASPPAARSATRCASCSTTSATTGSWSPPRPPTPTGSAPPTSPGCSSTRRARSPSCGRRTRAS